MLGSLVSHCKHVLAQMSYCKWTQGSTQRDSLHWELREEKFSRSPAVSMFFTFPLLLVYTKYLIFPAWRSCFVNFILYFQEILLFFSFSSSFFHLICFSWLFFFFFFPPLVFCKVPFFFLGFFFNICNLELNSYWPNHLTCGLAVVCTGKIWKWIMGNCSPGFSWNLSWATPRYNWIIPSNLSQFLSRGQGNLVQSREQS